jgi:hypothetical protein
VKVADVQAHRRRSGHVVRDWACGSWLGLNHEPHALGMWFVVGVFFCAQEYRT